MLEIPALDADYMPCQGDGMPEQPYIGRYSFGLERGVRVDEG
jgi:hypothetical protein